MKEATLSYQVTVADVTTRPTAVLAAATTWQEFPSLWKKLLVEGRPCPRDWRAAQGLRSALDRRFTGLIATIPHHRGPRSTAC